MIKDALKYIVGLKEPTTFIGTDGEEYCDKEVYRIAHNPKARQIEMNTLTSLIDYIVGEIDEMSDKMIIHVKSPYEVSLYSDLDGERQREGLVRVTAKTPEFRYGQFIDHESFCIALQAKFIENDDQKLILKFAGTVEEGSVAQYKDDGVSQKATIKNGISGKTDALIPNPVSLKPYRTFQEIEQPESQFIFRMKSDRNEGIQCAIFESDGGAWRMDATKRIKEFLKNELKDQTRFTIIS